MDERPDHALVLDLTRVLREFSDRQRDMLDVIQQLRLARTPGATSERPTVLPETAGEGWRTPVLAPAPPVPAPAPAAQTLQSPVPPGPRPAGPDPAVPLSVPVEVVPQTLPPERDYDYFDELDDRLARLRRDQEGGTG
jgi:hypothetical protein